MTSPFSKEVFTFFIILQSLKKMRWFFNNIVNIFHCFLIKYMILFIYNKSRGIKTMKKYILFCYFLLLSNILTGCSSNDTDGFFYNTFTKNMDMFLSNINVYVKSWGVSIIIITLIVKGIILPFMLKNYKKQRTSSINMEKAKPELDLVQSKIKKLSEDQKRAFNNDERMKIRIEQTELQKELFKIYKKYDCSPAIFGNLIPILIQAPFISGLYFTLQNPIYSKDILDSSFLSISLGEKSYILLVLVFVIYMIVGKISQSMMQSNPMSQTTPEAERIQNVSKNMVWITPIMLTFLTYTSIAAIGIYFVVSGILVTFQILLGRKLYPPYVPKPVKTSNKQKAKLVKR